MYFRVYRHEGSLDGSWILLNSDESMLNLVSQRMFTLESHRVYLFHFLKKSLLVFDSVFHFTFLFLKYNLRECFWLKSPLDQLNFTLKQLSNPLLNFDMFANVRRRSELITVGCWTHLRYLNKRRIKVKSILGTWYRSKEWV